MCEVKLVEDMLPVQALHKPYHPEIKILLDVHSKKVFVLPHILYLSFFPHLVFSPLDFLIHL